MKKFIRRAFRYFNERLFLFLPEKFMLTKQGHLYFISDAFFEKVNDPFLKINYSKTKRPHYFAFLDSKTDLFWLVPCSSKVEKFQNIIDKKKAAHKPSDAIKIVKIQGKKTVLLFQDMFPCIPKFIDSLYIRANTPVSIANPKTLAELEKTAYKVVKMLRRGVKFTPTQPDVSRIEQIMLQELKTVSLTEKLIFAQKKADLHNKQLISDVKKTHIKQK